MRIVFYAYLTIAIAIYVTAFQLLSSSNDYMLKTFGLLNMLYILTVIWWLGRTHFYYVWGAYLASLAAYYGLIHPELLILPKIIIYCTTVLLFVVTFYDVVVKRCKGVFSRANKRYAGLTQNK